MKRIQICFFLFERPYPFPRGDNYEIVKIQYPRLKIFLSRNIRPISFKLSTKQPWVKGISGYPIKFLSIFKMEMMGFFLSKKILHVWYNQSSEQMFLLIWTSFSGERCGTWASCYIKNLHAPTTRIYFCHCWGLNLCPLTQISSTWTLEHRVHPHFHTPPMKCF